MAAKEMYDYLSSYSTDVSDTLTVTPQRILIEDGVKNQIVHVADDGSEEVISLATESQFTVTLHFDAISEADAGTIFDFYHDDGSSAKGLGMAQSFKWAAPDGHTYAVRFASPPTRSRKGGRLYAIDTVKLRVLGNAS